MDRAEGPLPRRSRPQSRGSWRLRVATGLATVAVAAGASAQSGPREAAERLRDAAIAAWERGDRKGAERTFAQALREAEAARLRADETTPYLEPLANVRALRGDAGRAEKLYRRILADFEDDDGPARYRPDAVRRAAHNLAVLRYRAGHPEESEELLKGTVPRDVWLFLDEAEGRGVEPGDSYAAMPGGGGDPLRAVPFDYEWVPLVLAHLDVVRSARGRFARAEAAHGLLVKHLDGSRLSPALADYLGIRYAGYQRRAGRETQAATIEKLLRRAPPPDAGTPQGNDESSDERSGCLQLRDSLPASCVLELLE